MRFVSLTASYTVTLCAFAVPITESGLNLDQGNGGLERDSRAGPSGPGAGQAVAIIQSFAPEERPIT